MNSIKGKFKNRYRDFSIDLSFDLTGNGITAIYGRSGSGKSSLLRLLAGLDRAKVGYLTMNAECWQDSEKNIFVPTHERKIGFVSQDPSLFTHLNVRKNIEFGYARVSSGERKINFDEVVSFFGLETLLQRYTEKLSGGEKQRVAIARALLSSPQILLLDEPLSALDYISKKEILPYLGALTNRFQMPILYVSHDLPEVAKLCKHMLLLDAGRAVDYGKTREVITRSFMNETQDLQKSILF